MKAMILAAGLGTRLKPLTDRIPKALVEVKGVPMLERVILRLKAQGADYIVVNVHHFADQIVDFLHSKDFGIEIRISDERDSLLDTGGGIVRAMPLLFSKDRLPVLIHNVDILSNADLEGIFGQPSGTSRLLVSKRDSSRQLIFDEKMMLKGWKNLSTGEVKPSGLILKPEWESYAFSGIYSLTYEAVEEMAKLKGREAFPVMDYFLDPSRRERIVGIRKDGLRILDIGKPATLSQAIEFID